MPFASLWLAPRLPQFARLHPDVDLRVAASNNVMNLEREHVDLAIRWMPPGAAPERGEHVAVERVLPVCAPALLADPARPLVTPADLAHHVLLQFEPDRMSAPWLDWTQWLEDRAIALAGSAGTVRFSHYDQVIQAAIDGSGVALGRLPLVTRHLLNGLLVAPLGRDAVAEGGAFFLVAAADAEERPEVRAFSAWVADELQREAASGAVPRGR
ncbi:MAG: LysR substrate-binding domain-containing protein [Burkholderiales bacterium]|nr:LysR substrate-binding domain-containing protein [Burkholderiales bacterium]